MIPVKIGTRAFPVVSAVKNGLGGVSGFRTTWLQIGWFAYER